MDPTAPTNPAPVPTPPPFPAPTAPVAPAETMVSPDNPMNKGLLMAVVIGILVLLVGGIAFAMLVLPDLLAKPAAPAAPTPVVAPNPTVPVQPAPTVPTVPPAPVNQIKLTVLKPTNGATVATATQTVSGQTVPNADVSINDVETKADTKGNFSARITLTEGDNPIVINAFDADGNNSELELTITYAP
jgi:hypothetical protein